MRAYCTGCCDLRRLIRSCTAGGFGIWLTSSTAVPKTMKTQLLAVTDAGRVFMTAADGLTSNRLPT
jgi:hypothetical protein